MREVKLKVNLKGIVQAYQDINTKYDLTDAFLGNNWLCDLSMLRKILDRNLEIDDNEYSDKEKEAVLNIIKNQIYWHFMYGDYKVRTMCNSHSQSSFGDNASLKFDIIPQIDQIMKSEAAMHRPGNEIRIQDKAAENADSTSTDLSTKTYIFEVGDVNLESVKRTITESLNSYIFCLASSKVLSEGLKYFKKYLVNKEYYTLDELYTIQTKEKVPLVDYGMNIIYENYNEIFKLYRTIKNKEISSKTMTLYVANELSKMFSSEDLKIIFSIRKNLDLIKKEKLLHNYFISIIEYMMNNTTLLKAQDGAPLKLDTNLHNFDVNYILTSAGLKKLVNTRMDELRNEIKEKTKALEKKKEQNKKSENSQTEPCTDPQKINEDEKDKIDIKMLEWKLAREDKQDDDIHDLLTSLITIYELKPVQIKYLVKKVEDFEKMLNMKLEKEKKMPDEVLEEKKAAEESLREYQTVEIGEPREDAPKEEKSLLKRIISQKGIVGTMLSTAVVLAAAPRMLTNYTKGGTNRHSDSENLLSFEDAPACYEQQIN